jgi:hypothetical protein
MLGTQAYPRGYHDWMQSDWIYSEHWVGQDRRHPGRAIQLNPNRVSQSKREYSTSAKKAATLDAQLLD